MGPEESMQIQSNLGSTIAMAFDECPPSHGGSGLYTEFRGAHDTLAGALQGQRWHGSMHCRIPSTRNSCCLVSIRARFMRISVSSTRRKSAEMDLDGYAVGGLAVGESHEEMYRILDAVVPHLAGGQANLSYGRRHTGKHPGSGRPGR